MAVTVTVVDLVDINKASVSTALSTLSPASGNFVGSIVMGDSVMFWKVS
jgi:hypothetical protein